MAKSIYDFFSQDQTKDLIQKLKEYGVNLEAEAKKDTDNGFEGMIFVLGDNREVSLDSRIRVIGCVERSQIAGKVACRVWPLTRIGMMH